MIPIAEQYLATYADGSQDLVTIFADHSAEIAARRNKHATWGIPTRLQHLPAEVAS